MDDDDDSKPLKARPSGLVPYWQNKLPDTLVHAMRHAKPYPVGGVERACDHTLRIELPALAEGICEQEQLQTLHALQKIIDIFAEKFDYGNLLNEPNQLMHNVSDWREQRKINHTHISDYDYLLIQGLARFQHKLNKACDQLEDRKPANIPLPYTIEIALSHGYHATSESEEVTLELQALHGTLWVLLSAAERVCDHDMPQSTTLKQLRAALHHATNKVDYFCSVEQGFEQTLESLLVQGETMMRPDHSESTMHVVRLLEKLKDQGRSS